MTDHGGTWPEWVKKAIVVAAVATAVVVATAVTIATCGAGSVAGVAMITTTATMAAKATEVAALQIKKGKSEGKSNQQVAKDTIESVFDNGAKIVGLTPLTKTASIGFNHFLEANIEDIFGGKQTLEATLKEPAGKVVPYAFTALAWGKTIVSIFSGDPVQRAELRGYSLK